MAAIARRQKEKTLDLDVNNRIYLIAILAILIKALISFSDLVNLLVPNIVHTILGGIFIVALVYKILLQRYSPTTLATVALGGLMCLFTYSRVNYYYLICSYLCIIAAQDIDFKKILSVIYKVKGVYLAIHIVVYIFVSIIAPQLISYSYRNGDITSKPRHYFFVSHANTFSMFLCWTVFEYVYVNYNEMKRRNIIAAWLVIIFFYQFTDSNTGLMVSTVVFLLMLVLKSGMQWAQKLLNVLSKYSFIFFTISFAFMTVIYTKLSGGLLGAWEALDDALTGRMLYGACIYDLSGWTLFGKSLDAAETIYWNGHWILPEGCDNTYIWMFVSYGYIYMLVVGVAFLLLNKKASMEDKLFILAYTLYGVMEAYIINATYCFPLLLLGKYLYAARKDKK